MPIRSDLRHFYGKVWKTETRPRILLRAENKCEFCGVPNHARVLRAAGWWCFPTPGTQHSLYTLQSKTEELFWTPPDGRAGELHGFPPMICRTVQIVLGVAHLNHVPGDDRDDNLKAMCQWCHLNFDKLQHHETRAKRKDTLRPLLILAETPPPSGDLKR